MSAPEDKVQAALAETKAGAQKIEEGGDADLKTKLEKVQHTADMWAGRANTISKENAELKEEIRRLKAGKTVESVVASMTEEQLGDLPKDYAKGAAAVSAQVVKEAEERQNEEMKKLRAEMQEGNRKVFFGQIGSMNSKFFDLVAPGGPNSQLWEQFKEDNAETFNAIMDSHNVSRFNKFVSDFCRVIGISNPSGNGAAPAAPDPRTTVGGEGGVGDGEGQDKTYSTTEYLAALEKAEDDFRRNGDAKAYRETTQALNKALNEGRVK